MKIRIGKRRRIQFTDKKHPFWGIVSALISLGALVMMVVIFLCAGNAKGQGGIAYGYLGIFNLVLSIVGFVMALRCYKQDDIYVTTPTIGSIVNGMIIIIYLILYIMGVL
nr:hypothetical protein [Eubacterium sp.]